MKRQRIGYLRVSTRDQRYDRQLLALEESCHEVRLETLSAVAKDRPVFDRLINDLGSGDTLVVADLDRAFRSTIDALATADALRAKGAAMDVLSMMTLDTETASGEFIYTVIAAAAGYERRMIVDRTRAGLEAARLRGVRLGRPPSLSAKDIEQIHKLLATPGQSRADVARRFRVSLRTLQRSIDRKRFCWVPVEPSDRPS